MVKYVQSVERSMVNYLQVIFMYIADITIFHRHFAMLDLIGILIIFFFNFFNALYKTLKRMDKKNLLTQESIRI